MIRLMIVSEFSGIGGAEIVLMQLSQTLKANFEMFCLCDSDGPLNDRFSGWSIPVETIPFQSLKLNWLNPFRWISIIGTLKRIIKKWRIELIYTNSIYAYFVLVPALAGTGIPVICGQHADIHPKKAGKRFLWRLSGQLIARGPVGWITVSNHLKSQLESFGVRPALIHCIPNGVDLNRFNPSNRGKGKRKELGIPDDALIIGTTGRLHPGKGQDRLIEISDRIKQGGIEHHLVVIGAETSTACESLKFETRLRRMIKEKDLENSVHLLGFRDDLPLILPEVDIYVSLSYAESFGLSVLEAMACGVPIVALGVGGLKDLVIPGENGFLVDPDEETAMGEHLIELAVDPALRRHFATAARLRAERYDLTGTMEAWLQTFNAISLQAVGRSIGR